MFELLNSGIEEDLTKAQIEDDIRCDAFFVYKNWKREMIKKENKYKKNKTSNEQEVIIFD